MTTETLKDTTGSHFDETEQFKQDILTGLSLPTKELPAVYCFDEIGSALFYKITQDPHYYLTQYESDILNTYKNHLALYLENKSFHLIELGPSAFTPSKTLIDFFLQESLSFTYSVIDPSKNYLTLIAREWENTLSQTHLSKLQFQAIHENYLSGLKSIQTLSKQRNVILLLGSNIGNLPYSYIESFLKQLRRMLNSGDYLLIGFDLRKNIDRLLRYYNNPDGLYQLFNLNILERINRELDGNFNIDQFNYLADYNQDMQSINHFLISNQSQTAAINALQKSFHFQANESIYLGSSLKYREEQIITLSETTGFEITKMFSDDHHFIDSLWKVNK